MEVFFIPLIFNRVKDTSREKMLLKKFQFWPENIKIETFDFHLWKKTFI